MDTRSTYKPSDQLVDLVLAPFLSQLEPGELSLLQASFSTHLRNAIFDLLHTMALSLQDTVAAASYPLAPGGRFSGAMQTALLRRVNVSAQNQQRFFELLLADLKAAGAAHSLHGTCWDVQCAGSPGELDLRVYSARPKRPLEAWELTRVGR